MLRGSAPNSCSAQTDSSTADILGEGAAVGGTVGTADFTEAGSSRRTQTGVAFGLGAGGGNSSTIGAVIGESIVEVATETSG